MAMWKFTLLVVVIFLGLVVAYYSSLKPYTIKTNNLTISAAFPTKPTITKFATQFSGNSNGVSTYQVTQSGISYILSISDLSLVSTKPNFSQAIIFRQMFNSLVPENEEKSGFVRAEVMGDFDGQVIKYKTVNNFIYGKYFIATNSLVAIYVKIVGAELTPAGMAFVDSLTIKLIKINMTGFY